MQRGGIDARIGVGNTETTEGTGVFVELRNLVPVYASIGPLQAVDINGKPGWINAGHGYVVIWEPVAGTFASVGGAATSSEAIAIARSVRFVDETTSQHFYNVDDPIFSTAHRINRDLHLGRFVAGAI